MKIIIILMCAGLLGCNASKKIGHVTKTWDEVYHTTFSEIKFGIPVYDGAIVAYKREGKVVLKVKLGEPAIVGVATKPEKWGFFQFPSIYRSQDNSALVAKWSMAADAMESYGKGGQSFSISKDGGKSWSPAQQEPITGGGLILPDGDRIEIYTPQALKVEDIQLPKPVGSSLTNPNSKSEYSTYYKLNELPQNLQGVYINRLSNGETKWITEHAVLEDSQAVRYSLRGLFPVVWWGDMHIAADGSIIAGVYPGLLLGEDGKVDPRSGVFFYRSTDEGRTWKVQGRIMPELKADPNGDKPLNMGFSEPGFEILSDGSFLCVMRSGGGRINPMYCSRSTDLGVTWSKSEPFTKNGVLPRMLQLDNGVIVLASGRSGVQLRFCTDGKGEKWTDPFEMLPLENEESVLYKSWELYVIGAASCGYTGLLATGPDSFLLVYSDFRYQNQAGEIRKAIKVREVIVTPRNNSLKKFK